MIGRQFPRADALSMVATPENSEEPPKSPSAPKLVRAKYWGWSR